MTGWPYDCGDSTCLSDHSIALNGRHTVTNDRRIAIYTRGGRKLTPAQQRRIRKNEHRSQA